MVMNWLVYLPELYSSENELCTLNIAVFLVYVGIWIMNKKWKFFGVKKLNFNGVLNTLHSLLISSFIWHSEYFMWKKQGLVSFWRINHLLLINSLLDLKFVICRFNCCTLGCLYTGKSVTDTNFFFFF